MAKVKRKYYIVLEAAELKQLVAEKINVDASEVKLGSGVDGIYALAPVIEYYNSDEEN